MMEATQDQIIHFYFSYDEENKLANITDYRRIERKSRALEHESIRIDKKEAWMFIVVERNENLSEFYRINEPYVVFQLMLQDAAYLDGSKKKGGKVSSGVIVVSIIFATIILGSCFLLFLCMVKNNYNKKQTGIEEEEVDELDEYDDPILQKSKERRKKFLERKKTIGARSKEGEEEIVAVPLDLA